MASKALEPGQGGYRILMWTIVALLILRPLLGEIGEETRLLSLFSTLVLLAGVWAVAHNRNQVIGLAILALVSMVALWGWGTALSGISFTAASAFFIWVAVILGKDIFAHQDEVSADMIYGGINVYLLIGMAFAAAYSALLTAVPGSINGLEAGSTFGDAIYFSFVTMTTLGYGDISPASDTARMLAAGEALLGQLYVAILLARLVAVYISGKN